MSNKEQQLEQTKVVELRIPASVCGNFVKDAIHFGPTYGEDEFAGVEMDVIRNTFMALIALLVNRERMYMEHVVLGMLSAAASAAHQSGRFDAQSFAQEALIQYNRFDVLPGKGLDVTIN